MAERLQWVEIIEPRTQERMYANLITGECVWEPPPGADIKKTDDNQWWELFDKKTSRFYYYNATSQRTVWHKPTNCDIIPLAKLQTLKNNSDIQGNGVNRSKEISTQTNAALLPQSTSLRILHNTTQTSPHYRRRQTHRSSTSSTTSSPTSRSSLDDLDSRSRTRKSSHDSPHLRSYGSQRCGRVTDQQTLYENTNILEDPIGRRTPRAFPRTNPRTVPRLQHQISMPSPPRHSDSSDNTHVEENASVQAGQPQAEYANVRRKSASSDIERVQQISDTSTSSSSSSSSTTEQDEMMTPNTNPLPAVHQSLRRKPTSGISSVVTTQTHQRITLPTPTLEKSVSLQSDMAQAQNHRPLSMLVTSPSDVDGLLSNEQPTRANDIEKYAAENLNKHKKGILGKKVPVSNMLSWTKDPIAKPMIRTQDKQVKVEAPEIFKLIQQYMGDRKFKGNESDSLELALSICISGWEKQSLRDEIYMQLCRQTTDNNREDSLQKGWELLAICLNFFPPSNKFYTSLECYVARHLDPLEQGTMPAAVPVAQLASACQRRLEKIHNFGAQKGTMKPTIDQIEHSKKSLTSISMFGSVLEDIMYKQKERFPRRQLPWVLTTLAEYILQLGGAKTEGIFRIGGNIDELNALKVLVDKWLEPVDVTDPHLLTSLLKLWIRELYEPLIPDYVYSRCLEAFADPVAAINIVHELPEINRLVLSYLIRFLQVFAAPEHVEATKMDVSNLAMVMAPNCLRCQSEDPRIIFENTRKEMSFIRTLILNLDTSFMNSVI